MSKKVMVIGLDGATLDIILPLIEKGKLPNLAKIIDTGAYAPLKSVMPPITPCAWTSSVTGKDPSKHGVFDFSQMEDDPRNLKSTNRTFVKSKYLWKLLTERGKKSIVVDVPLTYPPEDINGLMISRVMAPGGKNCTYPKKLYNELKKKGYIKGIDKKKIGDEHGADAANKEEIKEKKPERRKLTKKEMAKAIKERTQKAFEHMCEEIESNVKLARWLLTKKEWDFFMMVFMATDHAGHSFWHDQAKVKKIYEKVDEAIGELFDVVGEDVIKFLWSDHGFTGLPYSFNINEWLYDRGLLRKTLDIVGEESMTLLKAFIKSKDKDNKKLSNFRYQIVTDFLKSKAYLQSGTVYGVRINLKGRDKTGVVDEAEYEELRNKLIRDMKKLVHPLTNKKVFEKVWKKEEVYSMGVTDAVAAPDIFFLPTDMDVMIKGQFKQTQKIFSKSAKGYGFHHYYGVFFAHGEGIKNTKIKNADLIDMMPTVLHVMGEAVPEDCDGKVLTAIFEKKSDFYNRVIEYSASSQIETEESVYSADEEAQIKQRLEDLGYIE